MGNGKWGMENSISYIEEPPTAETIRGAFNGRHLTKRPKTQVFCHIRPK